MQTISLEQYKTLIKDHISQGISINVQQFDYNKDGGIDVYEAYSGLMYYNNHLTFSDKTRGDIYAAMRKKFAENTQLTSDLGISFFNNYIFDKGDLLDLYVAGIHVFNPDDFGIADWTHYINTLEIALVENDSSTDTDMP